MVEAWRSRIVLGLITITSIGLLITTSLQYQCGDQLDL